MYYILYNEVSKLSDSANAWLLALPLAGVLLVILF